MLAYRIIQFMAFLLLFADASVPLSIADDRMQSQHFFNTYCVSCHGMEKSKAGLRLDQIDLQQWKIVNIQFLDERLFCRCGDLRLCAINSLSRIEQGHVQIDFRFKLNT